MKKNKYVESLDIVFTNKFYQKTTNEVIEHRVNLIAEHGKMGEEIDKYKKETFNKDSDLWAITQSTKSIKKI